MKGKGKPAKKRADGGRTKMWVSGNPDVKKEAEARKRGGKVVGLMTGGGVKARLDRPGRKRGGRVGADKAPLSSAHSGSMGGGDTPRSGDTYGGLKPD